MLVGRGATGRIRVIDLGHTIAAEEGQLQNRSPVVRCSWRESKVKRFDWAPTEVKDTTVNFAFPAHAFDVYSLAVLALQLEIGSMMAARNAVWNLVNGEVNDIRVGALCLAEDLLRRMLGAAEDRPCPNEVLHSI